MKDEYCNPQSNFYANTKRIYKLDGDRVEKKSNNKKIPV